MLIQFSVENYLSFGEKTVFSMRAADHVKTHSSHVCKAGGEDVLRCALLYGANASGKTSFVRALTFARNLIVSGTPPGKRIPVLPFRLKAQPDAVSAFEFEIAAGHDRYSYGFRLNAEAILQEWLFRTRKGKETLLFERDDTENVGNQILIKFGRGFKENRQRLQFLAEGTRREQLFLAEAHARNLIEVKPIIDLFTKNFLYFSPDFRHSQLTAHLEEFAEYKMFLEKILKEINTGISSITTKRVSASDEGITSFVFKKMLEFPDLQGVDALELTNDGTEQLIKFKTQRRLSDDSIVEFNLNDESDGTQRFLNLASPLYFAPFDSCTLVVDELDRSLHAMLTRFYLKKFLEADTKSQLICTTHDTTLLDLDLVRPDEIWFVEKDSEHQTHLHSLAEFKEEQLEKLGRDIEKGYLQGRFGAIPFFGNPSRLNLSKDK